MSAAAADRSRRRRAAPLACCTLRRLLLMVTALWCAGAAPPARAAPASDDTAAAIRAITDSGVHPGLRWPRFADYQTAVAAAYEGVGWQPLWLVDGSPTAQAAAVIEALSQAEARGLAAADYDFPTLHAERMQLAGASSSAVERARFDTALTVALMRFIADSYRGRVEPRAVGFALDTTPKQLDLAALVLDLSRSADPGQRLAELQPQLALYARLTEALATMRALAARPDVQPPALAATVRPGQRDLAIAPLRQFLTALGDLPPDLPAAADPWLYDGLTAVAVQRFQRRHNLEPDAVLGPATRRALAVPLAKRVEQIELALERVRWLPQQFPPRFIVINIPAFRLLAFEDEASGPRLSMEVIVGSALRRQFTPVLQATMRYVVFGPFWNVPRGITRNEMLPRLRRDAGYLAQQDLEIVAAEGVLPPTRQSIDRLAAGTARLRQRPGPHNALGRVKFIFPNRSNVYLHDTPAVALFARGRRDFSHGCIRVADPLALAEFVLAGQDAWDRESIGAAMRDASDRRVDLHTPLPVYLIYSTAVVTSTGELRFFDDLYGHDAKLAALLAQGRPYSPTTAHP